MFPLAGLGLWWPQSVEAVMQAIHVFARTGSQAKMVQANPALREAVAVMRRTGWLDTGVMPRAGKSLP